MGRAYALNQTQLVRRSPVREYASRLAPWWRRAVAALFDSAIVAGIALAVRVVSARRVVNGSLSELNHSYAALLVTAVFAAAVYYPVPMWLTDGRTPGKAALSIRVVRFDSRAMTLSLAAIREVLIQTALFGSLALLPGELRALGIALALCDYIWPFWDVENRALHDLVLGTRVVTGGRIEHVPPSHDQ